MRLPADACERLFIQEVIDVSTRVSHLIVVVSDASTPMGVVVESDYDGLVGWGGGQGGGDSVVRGG